MSGGVLEISMITSGPQGAKETRRPVMALS
jgi:hypothetical protein